MLGKKVPFPIESNILFSCLLTKRVYLAMSSEEITDVQPVVAKENGETHEAPIANHQEQQEQENKEVVNRFYFKLCLNIMLVRF